MFISWKAVHQDLQPWGGVTPLLYSSWKLLKATHGLSGQMTSVGSLPGPCPSVSLAATSWHLELTEDLQQVLIKRASGFIP